MVEIETIERGQGSIELFFRLHGSVGETVCISKTLASRHRLMEKLQKNLPCADKLDIVEASEYPPRECFLLWSRNGSARSPE
jgi:hypothetical protein